MCARAVTATPMAINMSITHLNTEARRHEGIRFRGRRDSGPRLCVEIANSVAGAFRDNAHLINTRSSRYIATLNAVIPSVMRYARCHAIDGLMSPVVSCRSI